MKAIFNFNFIFSSLFLLFTVTTIHSQERKNYELLWKIDHKNSDKASYLFGTLHLKDARAFKFSDSVIPAIKKAEMFAMEIHPDSAVISMTESYYDTKIENVYKKILSKEQYQKLKKRFFEVNKIDLDSFPMKHPSLIESMLSFQKERPDDRRTFLDAYLYGIAFNSKKHITGLEKIEDQLPTLGNISDMELRESILSLLDEKEHETDKQIDRITQLYYEGDLKKIWEYVNDDETIDSIMIKRNHTMRNSMIEVMKTNTIFAAVGAAHLPGDQGLIALLRKEGYEVSRVHATFNDEELQYEIKPDMDRWVVDTNESMGYSVSTPSQAFPFKINESIEAMTNTDLIYGGTFMYMVADLRKQVLKENYDFVENIIKGQLRKETDTLISTKTFKKGDVKFTDAIVKKAANYARIQVVFNNNIVYTFMTENTLEEITSSYANAFFDSIEIYTPKIEPSVWDTHTDTMGAYSIKVPGVTNDLTRSKENPGSEGSSPFLLNIFSAEDKANSTTYFMRYNDQPVGYYINIKEDYYSEIDDYFKKNSTIVSGPNNITVAGNEGREYELLFSDKYHARAKLILRGNRTYLLIAQKYREGERVLENDKFYNSFKFLPYADASFDTLVNIQDRYSFSAPSKKVIVEEVPQANYSEYGYVNNYSSLDPTTSGSYLVQHIKLKPYYRKKSLQEFYDSYTEILTDAGDSITSTTNSTLAGNPAREIRIQNKNTHIKQRIKLLLDDDTILMMLTYLGDEEINEPRVDEFFNSLKIKQKTNKFDLTATKGELIFKHLKSKDSLKFAEAQGALNYYDFDASEYQLLERNLKSTFKDDTTYYGTKYYIINSLVNLEKPETLKTFTDYYKNKKSNYHARMVILEQLLSLKNNATEATYFDLLQNHKLERIPEESYDVMSMLSDTIPLFVANDDRFAKLADIDDYRDGIVSLYAYNITKDSIYSNSMPLLKRKLLSYMHQDAALYIDTIARKKNAHINDGLLFSYIEFSKDFDNKTEEVVKTLKLIAEQEKDNNWLQGQALMAAIKLDIAIQPNTLEEAFKDMYVRFELMESLADAGNTKIIPEAYLEPVEFAKLSLYNNVGDDYEGYPTVFNYLDEITVEEKNYYVFTFSYLEEDNNEESESAENYLGIVERQPLNISDLEMARSYTDWEIVEEDWNAQAIKLIKSKINTEGSQVD